MRQKKKKNKLRSNGSESSRPRILTAWCNNKVREMWHRNPKKFCSIETCLSENKRNINASEKKIRTAISYLSSYTAVNDGNFSQYGRQKTDTENIMD